MISKPDPLSTMCISELHGQVQNYCIECKFHDQGFCTNPKVLISIQVCYITGDKTTYQTQRTTCKEVRKSNDHCHFYITTIPYLKRLFSRKLTLSGDHIKDKE